MSKESIDTARKLLNAKDFGILSTLSLKLEGYPFGSVTPYCLDGEGMPIIFISSIAQHTINIKQDNRSSLTILKYKDDVQSKGRLCIIGNMEPLPAAETEARERYFRHFPKSRSYRDAHDFSFYRLRPVSYRFIGGFGSIHWFEPEDVMLENPFEGKGEDRVVTHMNEDHLKDLVSYCTFFKGMKINEEDEVRMVGIDSLGFDVFVNDKKLRFDFEEPISNAGEARTVLVGMSKEAGRNS